MGTANASVVIDITARDILSAGLAAGVIPSRFAVALDLANGTADGQCDLFYGVTETAQAAGATISYDLVGTALHNSFGAVVSFAEVCLIALRNNRTTAAAYLQIGPHATNGFGKLAANKGFWGATADVTNGSGNTVAPGGWIVLYDVVGVPAGAGASDILAVVTSAVVGSTNGWDLLIIGRSA